MSNVPEIIYSDCKRFKQILFNLIGNAIKFTYEGKISLKINYDKSKSQLVCCVEDTGIGIE